MLSWIREQSKYKTNSSKHGIKSLVRRDLVVLLASCGSIDITVTGQNQVRPCGLGLHGKRQRFGPLIYKRFLFLPAFLPIYSPVLSVL